MKVITNEDGSKSYRFEQQDENSRRVFEEALNSQNAVEDAMEDAMEALVRAAARIGRERQEAWRSITKLIREVDPEVSEDPIRHSSLSYSWILKEFVVSGPSRIEKTS